MKRLALILLLLTLAACRRAETDTAVTTGTDATTSDATTVSPDPAAAATAAPAVPPGDREFATTASMANLYEIEAGTLAKTRTTSDDYKQFAQTMIAQHREIGESYTPIAEQQKLPMPTALAGPFKSLYDQLAAAPAGSFDQLYRQQMIETHQQAVMLFQTEARTGQDPELKKFAAQWLPTIQHHLQMAEALPPAQ